MHSKVIYMYTNMYVLNVLHTCCSRIRVYIYVNNFYKYKIFNKKIYDHIFDNQITLWQCHDTRYDIVLYIYIYIIYIYIYIYIKLNLSISNLVIRKPLYNKMCQTFGWNSTFSILKNLFIRTSYKNIIFCLYGNC